MFYMSDREISGSKIPTIREKYKAGKYLTY